MGCFDEEPDGDPHGECAAEIARLKEELTSVTADRDTWRLAHDLQEAMNTWHPIATAPKDGTPFLAYDKTNEHPIMVHADYAKGPVMLGDECNYISDPTHWMPIPAPPPRR